MQLREGEEKYGILHDSQCWTQVDYSFFLVIKQLICGIGAHEYIKSLPYFGHNAILCL